MSKYLFSPSSLDKYQHLLDAEAYFESDLNFTDEGPKQSLEEVIAEREQELLDAINKVQRPITEASAKGTAFNKAVDTVILQKYAELKISSIQTYDLTADSITESADGFTFVFDRRLVEDVAEMVKDGTPQLHVQTHIVVGDNIVILHGYPDYIQPTKVTDLKTTGSYVFGKYERYWQRYTYPYILHRTGLMQVCDAFDFLVVELLKPDKKTGVINGNIYNGETYTDVSVEECEEKLQWVCGSFIEWIEAHRDKITNNKIFNYET